MASPIYIDDRVAVSPMPSQSDIEYLATRFRLVVVLVEAHELVYPLELWTRYGATYIHIPVKDFRAPDIPSLHSVVKTIARFIDESSGDVLIHCFGGKGRSGTVAAAYLVYRYGLDGSRAIEEVRKRVWGAIQTRDQELVVEVYSQILRELSSDILDKVIALGDRYSWGWRKAPHIGRRHATAVTVLSIRLFNMLENILKLSRASLRPLAIASLLHDIGRAIGEPHNEYSYSAILESQELSDIDRETLELAALIALHHRAESDPKKDRRCERYLDKVLPLAALIRVADGLDYRLRWRVVDIYTHIMDRELVVRALCRNECGVEIEKAKEKSQLLSEVLGKSVRIECQPSVSLSMI